MEEKIEVEPIGRSYLEAAVSPSCSDSSRLLRVPAWNNNLKLETTIWNTSQGIHQPQQSCFMKDIELKQMGLHGKHKEAQKLKFESVKWANVKYTLRLMIQKAFATHVRYAKSQKRTISEMIPNQTTSQNIKVIM